MKELGKKLNNSMETVETYYKNCGVNCDCATDEGNSGQYRANGLAAKLSMLRSRKLN